MAIGYTTIGTTGLTQTGPMTVLSDGKLAIVVHEPSAGLRDASIYTSDDGGATWTRALVILSGLSLSLYFYHYWYWVGDVLFGTYAVPVVNNPALVYKVTYSGGSFSLTVNGVTLRAAAVGDYYTRSSFSIEPDGTIWCALHVNNTSFNDTIGIYYSTDGGASWTLSVDYVVASYNYFFDVAYMESFLYNSVCVFSVYAGTDIYVSYISRAHTDAKGTWGTKVDLYTATGAAVPRIFCGPMYNTPHTRMLITGADLLTTPDTIFGMKLSESIAGALSVVDLGDLSINQDAAHYFGVAGFNTGWKFYYGKAGDTGHLYFRDVSAAAVAWPAEQTITLPEALASNANFRATSQADFGFSDVVHFFLWYAGSPVTSLQSGTEGMTPLTPFDVAVGHVLRASLIFDSAIAHDLRTEVIDDEVIPFENLPTDWVQGQIDIPFVSRADVEFDAVIAFENTVELITVTSNLVIPFALRAWINGDAIIPIASTLYDVWTKEAAESDTWVKESTLTDSWAKETAGADAWSKE